ncbi:Sec20 [Cynara cardunculus var. scolymus]|uniref:Sec20 n=1 Tax=Cynara cardunculus var. scolymus TaxID=59895 RepID=A0A103XQB6_CYNCS|nr:Sec20 [Cynara cardunculus var. scolymus]
MEVNASSSADIVVDEFNKTKKDWDDAYLQTLTYIRAIEEFGKSRSIGDAVAVNNKKDSLPRLNGLAQDGLSLLSTAQFNLDLLVPQLPTDDHIQNAELTLQSWNEQIQRFRELLLGGGEESTVRRRNLQTKAGMTSAAESITESLRRTRQLMVQEVERSGSTLMAFGSSFHLNISFSFLFVVVILKTGINRSFEESRKRIQGSSIITDANSIILVVGFLVFSLAVLYVVSKRIGILKLQRKVIGAIKAGMAGEAEAAKRAGVDAINHIAQVNELAFPNDLEQPMHDEL